LSQGDREAVLAQIPLAAWHPDHPNSLVRQLLEYGHRTIKSTVSREKKAAPLRVYVYHGNARRLDPTFLADFDVVITTYSTLATEYSEQTRSLEEGDEVASDSGNEANGKPAKTTKPGKRERPAPNGTEATSPLPRTFFSGLGCQGSRVAAASLRTEDGVIPRVLNQGVLSSRQHQLYWICDVRWFQAWL